jgi:hypothetical protein
MYLNMFRVRLMTFVSAAALLPLLPGVTFGADRQPDQQLTDAPISVSPGAASEQVPEVKRPIAVHRPASVSDEEYAREKNAAKNSPASGGAKKVPVPGSAATAPSIAVSFAGLNRPTSANNGFVFIPPDTISAKSPNRVIEATNSAIRLFNTTGGIIATLNLNSFFGAPTSQGIMFDPKVYFDRNATNQRVYVVALQQTGRGDATASNNVSRLRVAVSRSPDPSSLTSGWCIYNIDARGEVGTTNESWADFPAIGAGRDSFSMAVNNFRFTNDGFRFARIHVWNKNVAANNASSCPSVPRSIFQPAGVAGDFGLFTIQPAQHYTSPSSVSGTVNPAYYVSTRRGSSNQYFVHRIRNVASGSPTYTRVTLTSTGYGIPPSGNQPGSAALIDSGDNRVLQVAGIGNTLVGILTTVCNFTSGTPNESCTLAPRVSVAVGAGGALSASIPENTFAGFNNGIFVHHPSIATDTALRSGATWEFNGTGGGGFRLSSAAMTKNVNAGWVGVQTYASGSCAYGFGRAGDYAGAQLDPTLSGFWLAGERALLISGTCQWDTRIVKLVP